MTNKMNGSRRSAILLLSLDADSAAEVFKYLPSTDVETISMEMARLSQVSHEEMRQVLEEFMDETDQYAAINIQTSDHIRAVLTKALGSERAASLIDDILESTNTGSGIDKLNLMEASMVAEMIRDEHPQIIATILVHLERHQASDILQLLPDRLRNDIVLRIATFSGVQPVALQELTEVLGTMLDGQSLKRSKMGGVRTAAEILNLMNSAQEELAIDTVRQHSEDLAQKILDEMFLFENLIEVDDRGIQMILQQVEDNSLAIALKGAPPALLERFLNNMSQRASQLFREDMEARGPIRMSQVEAEQKAILQIVRRLSDSGEIVTSRGNDAYV
ncbi:flagellar motor switch protein FliG [Pseudomonas lijiangensis]|uniref:Flagellar motor switch protein FliG n=1 Tax=Pseudomonas lijiangensis TaxID=2995658 RepID=A0ABX8HT26_9PSED|nr:MULTISPECIES: flagellar motor switch protein FliG [Pseudomonas syringae group]MBX8501117.1 flagellar motor switch protein FliG [Pseudomonas lijiangensis]MBX8505951.1 flagellar motor switch protein FliG [Pseudomonas lijiangensis]MBX8520661.1 flagellar motor switch protein FliG [Pseudomonas cichorii]MBX8554084.1 flagellar motor switch protein FliG [Pseudomonas cichorii]QWU83180.1 flagellar motor switch protein FliG [Pseudomonas lijiangensis]